MKRIILIFFTTVILVSIYGQNTNSCNCCSNKHSQFNFWIGDWTVYDTTGNILGNNTITLDQDKCLIIENWKSANSNYTGTSLNFYDKSDSTWKQIWVDNQGSNLLLKGNFIDGKMILKSELLKGQKVEYYYNQITWTPNEDGTVTQLWELYDSSNNLLSTAFFGIYKNEMRIEDN